MCNKIFQNLIKKDKYQVFIFSSLCPFPISFASHLWFVVNEKGNLSRWEVTHHRKPKGETNWGHIVLNFLPPFSGMGIVPFYYKICFKPKLLRLIEGDENSEAKKMADFIENSPQIYPFLNKYHFIGPNSNTYVSWISEKFPDFKVKIPPSAFGKNYFRN